MKYFLSPIYGLCSSFLCLKRWTRNSRLLLLNRKGSFRTESFPMENCRRRQSSSISVLLPTGDHNPSVSAGDGDSAAGIDSRQRVVKQRYLVSPSRFETPRSVPVTGDRAMAIFQLFYGSRGRSVSIQIDENLALLCAGQNRH